MRMRRYRWLSSDRNLAIHLLLHQRVKVILTVPRLLGGDLILVVLHLDSLLQLQVLMQERNPEVFVDMLGRISWFKMLDYLEIQSQLMLSMKSTIA